MVSGSDHGWPASVSPDLREIAEQELTPKQLEVLKLVARNYGDRRIAAMLSISREAARDRRRNGERKMLEALERLAEENPLADA